MTALLGVGLGVNVIITLQRRAKRRHGPGVWPAFLRGSVPQFGHTLVVPSHVLRFAGRFFFM